MAHNHHTEIERPDGIDIVGIDPDQILRVARGFGPVPIFQREAAEHDHGFGKGRVEGGGLTDHLQRLPFLLWFIRIARALRLFPSDIA